MDDSFTPSFKNLHLISPTFIADLKDEKLQLVTFEGVTLYFVKKDGATNWNQLVGSGRIGIKWSLEHVGMTSLAITDGKLWVSGIDDKTTTWHIRLDHETGTILEKYIK